MLTNIQYLKPKQLVLMAALLFLSGCAQHYTGATYSDPYGFFSGILHGFLLPFAFIANVTSWVLSFFNINIFSEIQFVGRPNTGFLFYYIGYILGLSAWGGGGAASSR